MKNKNRKKILFIANILTHHKIFNDGIIQNMAKKGFDVKVIAKKDKKYPDYRKNGVEFIEWQLNRGGKNIFAEIRSLWLLLKIIKKEKPDIVHNFTIKANIYGTISAKLLNTKKIINTITGLGYIYTDQKITTLPLRILAKLVWISSMNMSNLIIFMNKTDMNVMGKFLSTKKIVIPGHGIDEIFYSKKSADKEKVKKVKKEILLKKNELVITTIGRLIEHKGIYEFAKAAKIIREKYPGTKFVIVGATDLDNPTKIADNRLEEIENQGIVILKDRADVREILFLTDIFVLATYMEAVPQVILEAMSMELPIVATDVSGCNERVIKGKNGYLAEVKNPISLAIEIEKILKNKKLMENMGQSSRILIEQKYRKEMMTKIISKYYD